ncbi:hypothetical protein Cgig2_033638 [Carnegiea gigantea]|uniref:Uncharacterized protein n=1 Tax=Carnegiea gigantea TaxID=171969 RepID=A0A9Q1K4A2_9CARY|nr:hypothetical protein Cgig2_033638 [Carnegiea gigantea]
MLGQEEREKLTAAERGGRRRGLVGRYDETEAVVGGSGRRNRPKVKGRRRNHPESGEGEGEGCVRAPVRDSSSASDEEGSAFEEVDKGTNNSAGSLSLSLEAEVSRSSGDVVTTMLRSKHVHKKGVSGAPHVRRRKRRGAASVTEMWSKRVPDKGGCSEVKSQIPRRSLGKVDNVQEKRERERGNKGKSGTEEGMVVEKEREGIGDAIVRHWCTLEAVCSLNSEMEECQKSAIEGTVWNPILKYKPFVMDRHLVRALVESRLPVLKAFRIGQREAPFSVSDVALLIGLPAMGKHVTFDQGWRTAIDDHISRERARQQTGRADMRMYQNYVSVIIELCKNNRGHKREDPIEEKLADAWVRNDTSAHFDSQGQSGGVDDVLFSSKVSDSLRAAVMVIVPYLEVWDLERREATVKAFSDTEDFNAYGITNIEEFLRRTREALQTAIEALALERVVHATTKKKLEHMRTLVMGSSWGDSLLGGIQNQGLQCANGDGEGSAHASDRRVSVSQGDDKYLFHTHLHTADVGSAKDAQEHEPFGDAMQHQGETEMVAALHATEEDVVPTLACDTEQPHTAAVGEEGDVRMAGEGSNSSIAKRIQRSARRQQHSAKQIPLFVNPAAALRTSKRRMGNVYTSRKRCRKATPNASKGEEVEELRGGARQVDNVAATDMAVIVPIAVADDPDHGPLGIHNTMGHFEEAQG